MSSNTNRFQGTENGYLDFNLISLFPPTYKDRPNGLRVDLAQVLEAYHPVSSVDKIAATTHADIADLDILPLPRWKHA